MADRWLYIVEPRVRGVENMVRDESMAVACLRDGIPRLRMYSWAPWALSLGHGQLTDDIDVDELALRGVDLVRRPTGGRAVLHAEELTYAVAMRCDGRGIHDTYARISDALRIGLESIGARDLEFSRTQPDFRSHYRQLDSASCFSVSALNELTWQGRKLLGSAQRRYEHVLLQHGSLLLGEAHLQIVDLFRRPTDEASRNALRGRLRARTATLTDVFAGEAPEDERLADAIVDGFAQRFTADPIPASFADMYGNAEDESASDRFSLEAI